MLAENEFSIEEEGEDEEVEVGARFLYTVQ
jgi:hypothetical protein